MEKLFCIYCGKQFQYDAAQPPQFCLYCGKKIAMPEREPAQPAKAPDQMRSESETLKFVYGETAAPESNTEFCSDDGTRLFTGWLPEGFQGAAKQEMNLQCTDYPLLFCATANHPGTHQSWFSRRQRAYSINKLAPQNGNPFRLFDDYLDENAAALLRTNRLRLIDRVTGFDEVQKQIYDMLMKRKQQIESQSRGNMIQFVVQGEYGADGGKLYEADINGSKRYLLLYTTMIADEFGSYSPQLIQSQARTNAMLQGMQMRGFGGFGGFGFPQPNMQTQMPMIDTDPNTPFGRHRTDGLTTNSINWVIFGLSGLLSETRPTRDAVRDFLRFMNSLKLTPEIQQQVDQIKDRLIMQQMADQQQAQQIMGQMVRDQQRSFDRRNEIMRDLNAHRENLFQQRVAADNAAFDRRSRLQHEAIMGVDTYMRTDGTTVEADVSIDRVFQRDYDPTQLIGAPKTADVPFGWTELEKLK